MKLALLQFLQMSLLQVMVPLPWLGNTHQQDMIEM